MKHVEVNQHFTDAEKHIADGNHKEAWNSINRAQQASAHHARTLSESSTDGHHASLAYRKIVMARVGHFANKMKETPEEVKKAFQLSEIQIAKAEALSFVWELMKKDPAKFKYLIPQIELAKTIGDIHSIFKLYGFQVLRKTEEYSLSVYEELIKKLGENVNKAESTGEKHEIVVGNKVYKVPQTAQERDEQWRRIITSSKEAEKLLTSKKKK